MPLFKPAAVLAAALAFGCLAPPALAELPALTPGASFFNLSLERADAASAITSLDGRMVDSITETACGVFRDETRLQMDLGASTGQTISQVATSLYVEDGDTLTFDAVLEMNGQTVERAKGTAVRTPEGTTVTLELPQPKTVRFDEEVTWPMEMVRRAVEAAEAGETHIELRMYDGLSGGEALRLVSVMIGPPSAAPIEGDEAALVERLGYQGRTHWPITFTAFPNGAAADATPEYSISSDVFDDGSAVNSVYDFTVFAMRLHLVDFKPAASSGCARPAPDAAPAIRRP
jgi:uncharacterized protein YoaH (UPF0181 family)